MSDQPQFIRNNSTMLSYESRTGLNYVSQATGLNNPDALADTVILNWLEEKHANVMAHIRLKKEHDDKFRAELKKQLGTPVPFQD